MKFQPGHEKVGGRAKGVPNRRTMYLHEVLEANGFSIIQKLIDLLPRLDDASQADVLLRLLPYLYPQRKSVDPYLPLGEVIPVDLEEPKERRATESQESVGEILKRVDPHHPFVGPLLENFK